ncbi:hypothetical protein ACQP2P_11240 [Dactylosporangium sp. CA-139114]|uniref:hypothetical protein n=1 Tax=Dactylosporangium sp. CA-139114 TaxID=3239931 RepID=UPI003D986F46
MTTTPSHRPVSTGQTGAAPADPHTEPPGLVCPECGEPARAVPPTEWPLDGSAARPGHSHHDGTPLCPVPAHPGGSQPAEPVAASRSTAPDTTSPATADPAPCPEAPAPTPPEVVYLVAGGDMVAVFADEASADIQETVMIGAGLDTIRRRLTWAGWTQARAELRRHLDIEIVDVSGGPA